MTSVQTQSIVTSGALVASPAPRRGRRRSRSRGLTSLAWWLAPVACFLGLWQVAVTLDWVNETLLPGPVTVARAISDYFTTGEIWPHLKASLKRGISGFVISILACIPLGVLIGRFKLADRALSPLVEIFRQLPSLAMFPVFLLFFGIGFKSQVAMVVWASSWPILLTTINGTENVDQRLIKAARTLGAGERDLLFKVILPSAIPTIATGLRLGGSYAFLVLVGAEMIGANSGIGFLVINNQYLFRIPQMYASIVLLGAIGLIVNYSLIAMERRLSRWRRSS